MSAPRNIVILTGAGISAESGLATFRGPGGLWEGHRVEDVCTPEALARDPALVHRFYDARRAALASVAPNAAHEALARLDAEWPGDLLIVTQNVDDLHERGGARRMLHMHGELLSALCARCDARRGWTGDLPPADLSAARAAIEPQLNGLLPDPHPVAALALMGEDADGRFHLIRRCPLAPVRAAATGGDGDPSSPSQATSPSSRSSPAGSPRR